MQVSYVMELLQYFPQDAEVVASDYGLHVYLNNYKTPDGIYVPSYNLAEVDIEDLPWLKDSNWLNDNRQK